MFVYLMANFWQKVKKKKFLAMLLAILIFS